MSAAPTEGLAGLILSWLSLGVGVIGVAFALRPQAQASGPLFWAILLLGILAILAGGALLLLRTRGDPPRWRRRTKRRRHLVALGCEGFSDALSIFIDEQLRSRPRKLRFGNGAARLERWESEVKARYRKEFLPWGLEIFDEAAQLGCVAASSRSLVEAPSIEQLQRLPGFFRDVAGSLETA